MLACCHYSQSYRYIDLLYIIYKCIPADDILMMISCISPLSSQYCPPLTVLDITFPHDLILQNSANILHHRVVTGHRGEGVRGLATVANTNQSAGLAPSLATGNLQTFINCLDNPPKMCALLTLKYQHSDKVAPIYIKEAIKL